MKKERGWAIAGKHGLYIGWWQRRSDAIAQHVYDLQPTTPRKGVPTVSSPITLHNALEAEHRTAWRYRRKCGDRCVRVTLSYR